MTAALKSSTMYAVSDLGCQVGNMVGVIDD